jgi:hypothetical protein
MALATETRTDAAIAVAIALRRDMAGEWPLPLAGVVSLLCGMLLLLGIGAPDLA